MDEGELRLERLRALVTGRGPVNEVFVLEEADALAAAGEVRAMRLMANILGCGFGCPVDWGSAVRWLGMAAEAGDENARAQFGFLIGNGNAVDLEAWRRPRPGVQVCHDPRVFTTVDFLNARECDWVMASAAPLFAPSLVYDPNTGRPVHSDVRTNSVATFTVFELNLPLLLLRERISASVNVPVAHLERLSVFRYQVGQRFAPHADYLTPSPQLDPEITDMGQRPLTFLVYLNDDFEGGETHFTEIGQRFRCNAGGALYFHNLREDGSPNARSFHEGMPPTRGEKWLMSQFIRDKPQLPG